MPKIIGAHAIIYSKSPEADRGFLRDVVDFPSVDVGGGWLIFALPPAEVAVHPSDGNESHELYLMVDELEDFIAAMASRGVACGPPRDLRWGVLTDVALPSGARLGVYQPRHARPTWSRRPTKGRRQDSRKARPIRRRTKE